MAVMTVNGVIDSSSLGIVSPHEHAMIDIRNQYAGENDTFSHGYSSRVTEKDKALLFANPYAMRDNLVLDDEELCLREVELAVRNGLNTFVDVTLPDIGRDVRMLKRMSDTLKLNVIAGCGLYTQDTHRLENDLMTPDDLAEIFIKELTVGIDDTDICAGIIGEMGTSAEISVGEKNALKAAAIAHNKTGAPIMVHLYPWGHGGLDALEILCDCGVAPSHVCLCHTDVPLDTNYMKQILSIGAYLEFDDFGKEFSMNVPYGTFPDDDTRLDTLFLLADAGFEYKLLASCDICLKNLLTAFGGKGYAHVVGGISEKIKQKRSDSEKLLALLLKENPAKYLDNPKLTLNNKN